jgi:hypothetical protein
MIDATYALTNRCFPLSSPRKIVMKNWLKGKKLYTGDTPLGERHFTPENTTAGLRFMDIITGTMYLPHGQCLTSSYLKVNTFKVLNADITQLVNYLVKTKKGLRG